VLKCHMMSSICTKPASMLWLVASAWLSLASAVTYVHEQDYMSGFFDQWDFVPADDPTHGTVDYITREDAERLELVRSHTNGVFIGVDNTTVLNLTEGRGRKSIRLESTKRYNDGLFIITLDHAPTGCGSWPAFWMFGEDTDHIWPEWGEFDIIEWIHDEENVSTTLHTKAGCTQSHLREGQDMKGWWNPGIYGRGKASNCDVHAQGQWQNQGCSQRGLAGTVGPSFNAGGGGTYAAEWDPLAGHMRVWFWPSGSEPEDAKGPTPDPELWGQPDFYFELSDVCAKSHFKNMKLVFDITFCGDLGSPTFHEHCGAKAGHSNCDAFVRQEPWAFHQTYWWVSALDVYHREESLAFTDLESVETSAGCRPEHVTGLESRIQELEGILAQRDGELRDLWAQLKKEGRGQPPSLEADLLPPGHGPSVSVAAIDH